MAEKKPLCIYTGEVKELQGGDTLPVDHAGLANLPYAAAGHTGFQPMLVSATNIKTINSTSLLGSGDIVVAGAGLTWSEITDASKTMVPNEGYRANKTTLQTFTLPASCAVDAMLSITGIGVGLWKIILSAGQNIIKSASETTALGYLASTHARDCVTLQCVVADTIFQVVSYIGTLTVNSGGICGTPIWSDSINWNDTATWIDS